MVQQQRPAGLMINSIADAKELGALFVTAGLFQATINKEWQAAINQTWQSKPPTDRITMQGMQRLKRLMVQPKPLTFLIDTRRTRTPIVRLEYAHVIKNDFKSLED
jgi:hypothetical protein